MQTVYEAAGDAAGLLRLAHSLPEKDPVRTVLHEYFAWATTTTMSRYHRSPDDVPEGLGIPRWSWDGLQDEERGRAMLAPSGPSPRSASSPSRSTMPSAEKTLVINRPVEEVFAFFTNPANDQKWRPHVKEISATGAPGVGARIHQVVAGPGGRGISADIEVTAYEPTSHYGFQVVTGPARPRGEFHFTPSGAGTQVRFALEAQLSGVKKLLMAKPVQSSMDSEVAALQVAKSLLESA